MKGGGGTGHGLTKTNQLSAHRLGERLRPYLVIRG